MKLSPQTEEKIKEIAISYLKECKPDWDIPHTLNTVEWMKRLIKREGGNEKILITTMYLHDIGYPKLQKGYDFDDLMESKKNHAELGAIEAKKILKGLGFFSESEIMEIAELISGHYEKNNIDTFHQQLVIEADGLSKIDWYHVTPNFDKTNLARYFEYFKMRTLPCFKTQTGKEFTKDLLEKAKIYLSNMQE